MPTKLTEHPAAFDAGNANNWITVATAIAQLFVMIAPILAQIFGTVSVGPMLEALFNKSNPPAPPQG